MSEASRPPHDGGLRASPAEAHAREAATDLAGQLLSSGASQIVGARERQEDCFAVLRSPELSFAGHAGQIAIVADGMGGMAHGEAASHAAIAAFLEAWQAKPACETIPEALARALRQANGAVVCVAATCGVEGEMGSTLVAAVVREDQLHWVSAGDSLLLLVRDGEITQLNTPHTFAEELDARVSRGEIADVDAAADEQRSALTSFLGQPHPIHVDRTHRAFPLLAGDLVLIASDGLSNALTEEEILNRLDSAGEGPNGGPNAQKLADALTVAVDGKRLSGQDNTTVVALLLPREAPASILDLSWSAVDVDRGETVKPRGGLVATPGRRSASRLPLRARLAALMLAALLILAGVYWRPRPPVLQPAEAQRGTQELTEAPTSREMPAQVEPPSRGAAKGARGDDLPEPGVRQPQ